jgi:hypothetical protein
MNIGAQMQYQLGANQSGYTLAGWNSSQTHTAVNSAGVLTGKDVETYGTSWLRDLLAAKQYAPASLKQSSTWFTGGVDANEGATPFMHGTHDLGMAFDLGISNYIGQVAQAKSQEQLIQAIKDLVPGWSIENAKNYSALLSDQKTPITQKNDQISALRDFLSLYAVTKSDGVTSDLTKNIINTTATSLFGGLINNVHIGGQSYTAYEKNADGSFKLYPSWLPIIGGTKIPTTMHILILIKFCLTWVLHLHQYRIIRIIFIFI